MKALSPYDSGKVPVFLYQGFTLMKFWSIFYTFLGTLLFINSGCKQKSDEINITAIAESPASSELVRDEYFNQDIGLRLKKYEDPSREYWQNPELVIDKLGDFSGKTVADIGVGTGYFTFRIAPEAGKVIAVDIENKFLEYIEDRKFELGNSELAQKIETRLCEPDDPHLREEEIDIALIVNTYHFMSKRVAYLQKIHAGLKKDGILMLVDYRAGEMPVGPPESLKISMQIALEETLKAGFKIIEVDTSSLQFQYLIKAIKL